MGKFFERIPDKVTLALARYYHDRDNQEPGKVFDKPAALERIIGACRPFKIDFDASAGTFFFYKVEARTKWEYRIECNRMNYLTGGKRTVTRPRKINEPLSSPAASIQTISVMNIVDRCDAMLWRKAYTVTSDPETWFIGNPGGEEVRLAEGGARLTCPCGHVMTSTDGTCPKCGWSPITNG